MAATKVTIIDVARLAGVSKGTVDRVVYNRGGVSSRSEARVRKAIADLGYEPNLHASLLASRRCRLIACLLPEYAEVEYWAKLAQGFAEGGRDVSNLGVGTELFTYDQYDPESFKAAVARMLDASPDGVVISPLFRKGTVDLAAELSHRDIPYVYVDTRMDEPGYLAFFGMPMRRSGALAAMLLTERCTPGQVSQVAIVRISRDKAGLADPTVDRRAGFIEFMAEHFPDTHIHNVFINPQDPVETMHVLEDFFSLHSDVRNLVMFNSRAYLLRPFLESHPIPGRRFIGYDDLDSNLAMLRAGCVDILIAQHTASQSRNAVKVLSDYILMHKDPILKNNHMHMDILTSYNIEDY